MVNYPIAFKLKDGTPVTIREMAPADEKKSLEFFRSLPFEERQYLRIDVTQPENIHNRMNPGPFQYCWRLVAEKDDCICGDATICRHTAGWKRHISELRCIILPEYQKQGLGKRLLFELFQKVLQDKTEMILCEVVPEQKGAISVLEKLGFHLAMRRPNHVKDVNGEMRDLLVYKMDVTEVWDTLQHYFHMVDLDYPRV